MEFGAMAVHSLTYRNWIWCGDYIIFFFLMIKNHQWKYNCIRHKSQNQAYTNVTPMPGSIESWQFKI
jgi:hypothetical protein